MNAIDLVSAPAALRHTVALGRRALGRLVLSALVVGLVAGCQLKDRDSSQENPEEGVSFEPLLSEADALVAEVEALLEETDGHQLAVDQATNEFLSVPEGIQARMMKLKDISAVLSACWSRPVEQAECDPPKRALKRAQKPRRKANEQTKAFFQSKLDSVERLRPLLLIELPQVTAQAQSAVGTARTKLDDLRMRFEAEASREGADPAAVDEATAAFQAADSRIQARLEKADQGVSRLSESLDTYSIAIEGAIGDAFAIKR